MTALTFTILGLLMISTVPVWALDNGLARTPALGYAIF